MRYYQGPIALEYAGPELWPGEEKWAKDIGVNVYAPNTHDSAGLGENMLDLG